MSIRVSSKKYFREYHGHRVEDLEVVLSHLRKMHTQTVFLAGDSSLDNKFWFGDEAQAVNGYENILDPPVCRKDIAYWMNVWFEKLGMRGKLSAINCAVEESTIEARSCHNLLPQDKFIRDNIQANDIFVISVGGNDVALRPSPCTALSVASLVCCTTTSCIKQCTCGCSLPYDDYLFCGALSNFCACPFGMGYMIHLFSTRIQSIVSRILTKQKPKLIVICMIYYLDEKPGNSWAETILSLLGYNSNPEKLQEVIKQLYHLATERIYIPNTKVLAIPLFEVLNGKNTLDYCERVEPSAAGGEKMSEFIVTNILTALKEEDSSSNNNEKKEMEINMIVER